MKIPIIAGLALASASVLNAASVSVFLDSGAAGKVPGSTNTATPFANNSRESTWDITSSAQTGLSALGAAVMEVRMITVNINGDSRRATVGGGNGLGVDTGGNANWIDGSSREAGIFQFKLYSDVGKTMEITGLTFTLSSVISRMTDNTNHVIDAFAGGGAITFDDGSSNPIGTPAANASNVYLGGSLFTAGNDAGNSSVSDLGIISGSLSGATPAYYTATSSGVTFDEDDTFWLRRRNGADAAYQLGGYTLDIVPEPTSSTLFAMGAAGLILRRRRA
ncbi:PEP-CTERM sorting domain-containing protein [Haloferula sp.]|uniref:PEP-CTERM sorting domain-containing protein n=1 Tax=Haloferula sp. TaxID=2497595 RepID=UPI00329C7226